MATCTTCGNDYELAFEVKTHDGHDYAFDSIECAAHKIAPRCAHCECVVLGHGIQADAQVYCCANCAREDGIDGVADSAAAASA